MSQSDVLENRRPFTADRTSPLPKFSDHAKKPRFSRGHDALELEEFAGDALSGVVELAEQINNAHP